MGIPYDGVTSYDAFDVSTDMEKVPPVAHTTVETVCKLYNAGQQHIDHHGTKTDAHLVGCTPQMLLYGFLLAYLVGLLEPDRFLWLYDW